MSLKEYSVLLVDDHSIVRGGIRMMLAESEFVVTAEAASGMDAIAIAKAAKPDIDIVLLDIRMAGGDGFDALVGLKAQHPKMTVVMLTTYDNPTYIARAVAGGASGYLLKGIEQEDLLASLRAIVSGEMLLTAKDLMRSLRGISDATHQTDLISPLTQREEEVLRLLSTGLNNRAIAELMFIAEGTVKTHVEHIIGKLGVSDRVQAAVWAARQGIVTEADLHSLSTR
ncbi:MAG: response regulator transcription factor [Cytophagaceae bacterium]|nr:MAG: response regulator transcription factor [Cytophagaceae bacterium]